MTLMLVILAVLGAGFVVVMALGRFTHPGTTSIPKHDDSSGSDDRSTGNSDDSSGSGVGPTGSGDPANDDGVLARHWKRGEVPLVRGIVEPAQNLPPVLLPLNPEAADVDRLRFSAGLRGYRMDQVDEILDILRDALAAKDQQLDELKAELAELAASSDGSAPDRPSPGGSVRGVDGQDSTHPTDSDA